MSHWKTLGLALIAVLAMSAVVASAASAQFTASSYPKSATGQSSLGNEVITTEAGKTECKGHFAVGPLNAASTSMTVNPTYTECKAFGFPATLHMNKCDKLLTDIGPNTDVRVDILCPAGSSIVVTAGPCVFSIPAQTDLGSYSMANSGTGLSVGANLKGLTYNVTTDGFLCPFNGTGHKTGGLWSGLAAILLLPTEGGSLAGD